MTITKKALDAFEFFPSVLTTHDFSKFVSTLANSNYAYKGIVYPADHVDFKTGVNSVYPAADIDEFPVILNQIVEQEQEVEGIPKPDRVEIVEEHVDLPVERETISWSLVRRIDGLFAQGKPGDSHIRERSYHLRNVTNDPIYPGHHILYYGHYMDNTIQLTTWAPSGRTANNRAIWLESLIDKYRWFFLYRGINSILFQERVRDMYSRHNGVALEGRPLIYFVRTEKIIQVRVATLKRIVFNIRGPEAPELRD